MKTSVAVVCLAAWLLAAIALLVFILGLPAKTVVSGIDVSHAANMLLVQQAIFIAVGLASAIWAWANRKWRLLLVVASSLLYLLHWFPWRAVSKVGLIATAKSMYLLGSTPGLQFISLIRDVVLPIAFAAAFILAILETRRHPTRSETP